MRPADVCLAVLVAAVWGVNFTVIEVGLDHFPPLLFSALRFLVAALPAVFLVGPPKVAWKWIVGVGLALGVAKFGLLFIGMHAGMPGGLSSLVLQIQAVFTALVAVVLLGERPTRVRVAGMAVALAGIGAAAVDEGASARYRLRPGRRGCGLLGRLQHCTRKASPPARPQLHDLGQHGPGTAAARPVPAAGGRVGGPGGPALPRPGWRRHGPLRRLGRDGLRLRRLGLAVRRHPASTVAPFSLLVPVFGIRRRPCSWASPSPRSGGARRPCWSEGWL
ncbi:O-acetylserine/cysteine efflux transporter OS=Streptomyces albaduncus OX=68172 GN=FHS32_000239 PE=4 SV=1 [Streptomyces griseoloalbus]